jgi:hypothetical protein
MPSNGSTASASSSPRSINSAYVMPRLRSAVYPKQVQVGAKIVEYSRRTEDVDPGTIISVTELASQCLMQRFQLILRVL